MEVEHSILIHAPAEAVWAATVDVANWPDWTPTVRSARALTAGPFGVGSRFALKQPLQPETTWEVTACRAGESFTWESRGARLLRATHRLEPGADGTLNVLLLEAPEVTGFLQRLLLRRLSAVALARENAGLKAFCERSEPR